MRTDVNVLGLSMRMALSKPLRIVIVGGNVIRKVEEPDSKLALPLSTYSLAQRRLKGLAVTKAAQAN